MSFLLSLLRASLLIVALAAGPAWAQGNEPIDYAEWEAVAQRAEDAVERGSASNEALEALRAEVSAFRDRLLAAQSQNDPRLNTLQSQLDALGPAPEEGASEPEEIASRRAELLEQIAKLKAPVRQAEEAYSRASGLVTEIDNLIRSRQADALLRRGPEPLNPVLWPQAVSDVARSVENFAYELRTNWASDVRRKEFVNDLPAIGLMLAIAALLVLRGPKLVRRGVDWMRAKTRRGTGVWSTFLSLGRILLPTLGLVLVAEAADISGLFGPRSTRILEILPVLALVLLLVRWLAEQTFAPDDSDATLVLPHARRTEARYYLNFLSFLIVLRVFWSVVAEVDQYGEETLAVLEFPVQVLCGILLFRLGQILRTTGRTDTAEAAEQAAEDGDEPATFHEAFHERVARLVGQAIMAVGVVGPALAAIGYVRVGEALIYPTIMSLGLFALLLVIQRLVRDLYHLVSGSQLDDQASLIPVLSGFVLALAAVPILALIWGARVADLTEVWARFREGFSFGETRISPTDFLTFAIVFAIGYVLTRLLQSGLRGSVLPKTKIDKGGQTAIVSGAGYIGVFLAAIIAITAAGIDLSSLAIVAGALSVGIGFGLQNIVSNFVSGIILLIERPISEGDWIEVGGQMGYVRDISVRSTRIETFDRTDVIVPNADLVSGTVTNYTRGNVLGRLVLEVGVAYGTDTRKVEDILYKIAREHPMVLMNPAPFVHFKGFGADSLDFDVRMILRDVSNLLVVRTEVNHMIAETFAREGIEIPFAQRDIWLRNPEALRPPEREDHREGRGEVEDAAGARDTSGDEM